jgi:hypothetical protein
VEVEVSIEDSALQNLNREKLIALVEAYAKNSVALDGVWFQEVERRWGMDAALSCDGAAWERFTITEARRIKRLLEIGEDCSLEDLRRALALKFATIANEVTIDFDGDALILRVVDCRVQTARKGKGMDLHPCKDPATIEYVWFARTINPRIQCTCESCYPDVTDDTACCVWRFTLDDQVV